MALKRRTTILFLESASVVKSLQKAKTHVNLGAARQTEYDEDLSKRFE